MTHNANPAGDPRQNKLLKTIQDIQWQRLRRNLEPIEMTLGETLCEAGAQLAHAYFPITSIFSLVYATAGGASWGTSRCVIGFHTLCGNVQSTKYVLSDYRRAL
jgi:hypothetical protein